VDVLLKKRASRNRTLDVTKSEKTTYLKGCIQLKKSAPLEPLLNKTIHQDVFSVLEYLPSESFDLIIADPPYHLTKTFNGRTFGWKNLQDYEDYVETWLPEVSRLLKPDGSMYICGDWRSSSAVQRVAEKYLKIQNRITWEREKGRGALSNWKNASEDIWFCTKSDEYTFNVDAVKLKRRVVAPYKNNGQPKDWQQTEGGDFRLTHPSNLWTDISVPFWSMPENTDHPTQKPEKLVAKMILASSNEGDTVFDPFLGSGTTSVVAKKLGRNYVGVEIDETYCALAEKRLAMVEDEKGIQGYQDGVFLERNTLALQQASLGRKARATSNPRQSKENPLFTDRYEN
jgi:site-specific DNA-methyltransferase (adenine-specific)